MAKRPVGAQGERSANLGAKYRLCPEPDVAERFCAWAHTRRFLRNLAIEQRQVAWGNFGRAVTRVDQCKDLTELRRELDWVWDLPAQIAQSALADVERAYTNWWDPSHPASAPVFEKRSSRLRFSIPGQAIDVRHTGRKFSSVWMPKVGWVRFRRHRPLAGVVRSATFFYAPSSGWSVRFGVAAKTIVAPPNARPPVGVDFGVTNAAFCSDEDTPRLMPPTLTPGEERRLLGLERRKARQLTYAKKHNTGRYSKGLRKTNDSIAGLRARQARRRMDFTHKLTHDLAKNHGSVGIEDLKVKNMTASARGTTEIPGSGVAAKAGFNRGILDNAPGERRRQLTYKCPKLGSVLVCVPPAYTSQTCAVCGARDPESRRGQEFSCIICGHRDHADHNAACNIEHLAARITAVGPTVDSTDRLTPSHDHTVVGASVKRVAPAFPAGRVESRVA